MITNIVEIVQNDLGYPSIQKIDPYSQEVKETNNRSSGERLAQSAIPAVLAGFFSFTGSDKESNYILAGGAQRDWLDTLFADKKDMAVEKIAH